MRIGVVAAVLALLLAEGGMLWYFAGERVARVPEELMTLAGVQRRLDAARRSSTTGLTQIRRSADVSPSSASDRRRIGTSFRLSVSVIEDCQRSPAFTCRGLDPFLAGMAAEFRDPEWAAEMEARLEQLVTRGEPDKYRIRSLECRSTRCAAEVASEVGYARVGLVSDDVLDRSLRWSGASAAAWEENLADGRPTVVTVATWTRREWTAATRGRYFDFEEVARE